MEMANQNNVHLPWHQLLPAYIIAVQKIYLVYLICPTELQSKPLVQLIVSVAPALSKFNYSCCSSARMYVQVLCGNADTTNAPDRALAASLVGSRLNQ
eukprot:4077760-Ditylum_brightwellii.AAC.1